MKFCVGPIRFVCHFGLNKAYARFPDGMVLSKKRDYSKWTDAQHLYEAWFRMKTGIRDQKAGVNLKECL